MTPRGRGLVAGVRLSHLFSHLPRFALAAARFSTAAWDMHFEPRATWRASLSP
eukprot:CAMPEP_0202772604 /NCGR_PEP_ID=MMETSP1388-20130828/43051_1 /ASSEMBLY_ACC=CAM_ASM_000864 /TAXON_ID=37098 /ORGANISM="Isochrysis sp, Strain CCMP1244" /LENGTH=52 /DNA_ID=CAMNT_0049441591 /DNA_START=16 /DNA_END=171 /DNA_ORIENTATION=+